MANKKKKKKTPKYRSPFKRQRSISHGDKRKEDSRNKCREKVDHDG